MAPKDDLRIAIDDVTDTLAELFAAREVLRCIRSDNSPGFFVTSVRDWLEGLEIDAMCIQPGSPWENEDAESFHA